MALICQLWPHGQDWFWCVLMTCVLQESLTCLVWFSKARLGRGLPAKNVVFGVWLAGIGPQWQAKAYANPGKQFSPKKLGWMTCAKDEATAWFYPKQLFVTVEVFFFNIISYSSSLCVEASIGRLLVSNFTLLTLPQLCSIMFILFLWLLFLQPKNSSHAASEVVQVLRSSWPLKEP